MKTVCFDQDGMLDMLSVHSDQECGKPLFDLLTKTHQKFENVLHPKISHIKKMFLDFFERRRQMMVNMRPVPEPKVTVVIIEQCTEEDLCC